MKGLFFNLIGIIKDAAALPQNIKKILREVQSVRLREDRPGKWSAMIPFLKAPNGSFMSPITAITEKNIDYFLIQVVNTYRGSTIIAKTGDDERIKEAKMDQQGIQRIHMRNVGLLMRVSENGSVEVYRISSPTENNKKTIKVFTLFAENLPFENSKLLDALINDDELLREFGSDLKTTYESLKQRPKFENKMDLSEVKGHIYRQHAPNREFKRVEPETPAQSFLPEMPKIPEIPADKPEKTTRRKKAETPAEKSDKKAAATQKKKITEKIREKEDEVDIKSVKSFADIQDLLPKK